MIRLDQVILLAYKAKNADIALAKASIFNVVGEQKNTYKWSGYYITEPKPSGVFITHGKASAIASRGCEAFINPAMINMLPSVISALT